MRKTAVAASAALILSSLSASVYSSISVEQIEAYENNTNFAPVNFGGNSSVTILPGQFGNVFSNITFNVVGASNASAGYSSHAYAVGQLMYGSSSVAYQNALTVYSDAYDDFLNNTVKTQDTTGNYVMPGNFSTGVKVVNCSWVADYGSTAPDTATTDTDAARRIDYMIQHNNVTFVAGATTDPASQGADYKLVWSSYNALAIDSDDPFNPSGSPGKTHGDLYLPGHASFAAAKVSGYATGLYSMAQTVGQTDAMQNVVNRSLLMAGADKTGFFANTANNLNTTYGAGLADYDVSLSILEAGEKSMNVATGTTVTGTPSTSQNGWSYGTIAANTSNVVLFSTTTPLTGLSASLNWNVAPPVFLGDINTTVMQFPDITLQVVPVSSSGGSTYTLGANQSNSVLYSKATNDNVQYLYDNTINLSAGTYAFVISGDPSITASVGFSYTLSGSFTSRWNSSGGGSWGNSSNWSSNIPGGRGAQVSLLSSPGITSPSTISLDGDRTLGQLTFNNSNGYTIAGGTGGSLFFSDTGDVSGTANPLINVVNGNQSINTALTLANGLSINVAGSGALNISGIISGSGGINKTGAGTLTFINSTGAFVGQFLTGPLNISGGTVAYAPSANKQIVVASNGVSLSGTMGNWAGRLDLGNNDLDVASVNGVTLANVTNQLLEGFNNGHWNGAGGIVSSTAAADTKHLTALGVVENNQNGSPNGIFGGSSGQKQFDLISPGLTDVLVKYTYYGDANLDGIVDGSDYSLIDNGYLFHLTSWYNGDFNYDGVINGSDYTLIDNAFNSQTGVIQSQIAGSDAIVADQLAPVLAVPEPGSATLVLGVCIYVLARRRPRRYRALS